MKKSISLLLAVLMMFSIISPVYADSPSSSTIVEFVGKGTESYDLSVPAKLAPGQSGTVTVSGQWASDSTVTVRVPNTVTLANVDDPSKTKELAITFSDIVKAGDDFTDISTSSTISIANLDILFGTWRGTLEYTVEMETAPQVSLISFVIGNNICQAEEGMTYREWVNSKYNTIGVFIKNYDESYLSLGVFGAGVNPSENYNLVAGCSQDISYYLRSGREFLFLTDTNPTISIVIGVFDKVPNQMEEKTSQIAVPTHPDDIIGSTNSIYGYTYMNKVFNSFGPYKGNTICYFHVD